MLTLMPELKVRQGGGDPLYYLFLLDVISKAKTLK